jgi:hypothetical protein
MVCAKLMRRATGAVGLHGAGWSAEPLAVARLTPAWRILPKTGCPNGHGWRGWTGLDWLSLLSKTVGSAGDLGFEPGGSRDPTQVPTRTSLCLCWGVIIASL